METQTTVLTKPVVTLKNVKTFRGMDGHGLNATVYVDGIKTAFIVDAADGGEPQYDIFNQEKFDQVKAWCEMQPKKPIEFGGEIMKAENGEPMMLPVTIDELVDNAFNVIQREKQAEKIAKKMLNHVMWGVPCTDRHVQVKMSINLDKIPTEKLQAMVDKYKKGFKPGEQFLNTNLVALKIKI